MDSLLNPYRMAILLLMISIGTISAVILTPALPQLAKEFHISESTAELTMSLFLLAYAIGQLPYGPIANRLGRKKAIFAGLSLMFIGSLLALSASQFWVLALGRSIQALGAAVGLKITFTMIFDQHQGQTATRAISFLSLAFALTPALGVAIGGYLDVAWGWRGCFAFMAMYAILLGFLTLALPETSKQLDPQALQIKKIACGYLRQFKSSAIVLNALLMGCISSSFYLFATLAPYVGINYIGLTPDRFGLWNLILCIGLFGGVGFTQYFAKRERPDQAILIGILIMGISAAVMILCFAFSLINVWTLFLPATFMRLGSNTIWSNASSQGMSAAQDKSNASAVMQFINLGASTTSIFLVSAFPTTQMLLLPCALGFLVLAMLILWKKTVPF